MSYIKIIALESEGHIEGDKSDVAYMQQREIQEAMSKANSLIKAPWMNDKNKVILCKAPQN